MAPLNSVPIPVPMGHMWGPLFLAPTAYGSPYPMDEHSIQLRWGRPVYNIEHT